MASVSNCSAIPAPTVSFVDALNAAVTAGYSVTVSGIDFAASATTPTATVGLSGCLTAAWASASSVVCMAAASEGVGHDVRVTVEEIVGTRTATFSYDGGTLGGKGRPRRVRFRGRLCCAPGLVVSGDSYGLQRHTPYVLQRLR